MSAGHSARNQGVKVFVTGATGLIGSYLVHALTGRGDHVLALSRRPAQSQIPRTGCEWVLGEATQSGPWQNRLAECDAVVHLAGESIAAHRWNAAVLQRIRESRVLSTERIAEVLQSGGPRVWVSGSAIGYYGAHDDEWCDESAPAGSDVLAEVCVAWEAAAARVAEKGVRVVLWRTGHVLAADRGVLPKMARPFHFFAGGPIGSGRQWFSWIHIRDIISALLFALDNAALQGPVNAVAPHPVRNNEFARTLGRVLRRPYWLPVPKLVLRLAVGRMAEVIVTGQRVKPRKLLEAGFSFRFPHLEPALQHLLARPSMTTTS